MHLKVAYEIDMIVVIYFNKNTWLFLVTNQFFVCVLHVLTMIINFQWLCSRRRCHCCLLFCTMLPHELHESIVYGS